MPCTSTPTPASRSCRTPRSRTNVHQPEPPERRHRAMATVKFSPDDPPHEVLTVLEQTAHQLPSLAIRRRAQVSLTAPGAYRVLLPVAGPAEIGTTVALFQRRSETPHARDALRLDGATPEEYATPSASSRRSDRWSARCTSLAGRRHRARSVDAAHPLRRRRDPGPSRRASDQPGLRDGGTDRPGRLRRQRRRMATSAAR